MSGVPPADTHGLGRGVAVAEIAAALSVPPKHAAALAAANELSATLGTLSGVPAPARVGALVPAVPGWVEDGWG